MGEDWVVNFFGDFWRVLEVLVVIKKFSTVIDLPFAFRVIELKLEIVNFGS